MPKSFWLKRTVNRDLVDRSLVVLVHQMAKVGSSSVVKTLRESLDIPVIQTHFLSRQGILDASHFFWQIKPQFPTISDTLKF